MCKQLVSPNIFNTSSKIDSNILVSLDECNLYMNFFSSLGMFTCSTVRSGVSYCFTMALFDNGFDSFIFSVFGIR